MTPEKIERIRQASLDLYSVWFSLWERTARIGEIYADLMTYSESPSQSRWLPRGDHDFFVFDVSVGDEAGFWTLYVTTEYDPFDQKELPQITSMWQVFDTMPNDIFMNYDNLSPRWLHTPESE